MSKPAVLMLSLYLLTPSASTEAPVPVETKPAGTKTAEKPQPGKA